MLTARTFFHSLCIGASLSRLEVQPAQDQGNHQQLTQSRQQQSPQLRSQFYIEQQRFLERVSSLKREGYSVEISRGICGINDSDISHQLLESIKEELVQNKKILLSSAATPEKALEYANVFQGQLDSIFVKANGDVKIVPFQFCFDLQELGKEKCSVNISLRNWLNENNPTIFSAGFTTSNKELDQHIRRVTRVISERVERETLIFPQKEYSQAILPTVQKTVFVDYSITNPQQGDRIKELLSVLKGDFVIKISPDKQPYEGQLSGIENPTLVERELVLSREALLALGNHPIRISGQIDWIGYREQKSVLCTRIITFPSTGLEGEGQRFLNLDVSSLSSPPMLEALGKAILTRLFITSREGIFHRVHKNQVSFYTSLSTDEMKQLLEAHHAKVEAAIQKAETLFLPSGYISFGRVVHGNTPNAYFCDGDPNGFVLNDAMLEKEPDRIESATFHELSHAFGRGSRLDAYMKPYFIGVRDRKDLLRRFAESSFSCGIIKGGHPWDNEREFVATLMNNTFNLDDESWQNCVKDVSLDKELISFYSDSLIELKTCLKRINEGKEWKFPENTHIFEILNSRIAVLESVKKIFKP